MDVHQQGHQIRITLAGDEAFDLLHYLRHDGIYRRTAEALCARLWALIGPPATGAAMERREEEPAPRRRMRRGSRAMPCSIRSTSASAPCSGWSA